MPHVTTDDGVQLYCEETGVGAPIVFVHEFAGDFRSYEPQVRYFSRRYRCITYNARGYPPSDVPADPASYSQERAWRDIVAVLDGLGIERAHVIGLSMGAYATLHLGLNEPGRAVSLVIAGCGYGAKPGKRAAFEDQVEAIARRIETEGMQEMAAAYGEAPGRVQYRNKNPRGWAEFVRQLAEHSSEGSALTQRGLQKRRPAVFELEEQMKALEVPTLIITGDEDESCLDASLLMKRIILSAALAMLPRTGHAANLEESDLFNSLCADFLHQVEAGRWELRDPQSRSHHTFGSR